MTDRSQAIAALQARRAQRGDADPTNRLTHHVNRMIAEGAEPVAERRSLFQQARENLLQAGWVPNPALYTVVDGLYSTRKPYQD